MHLSFVSTYPPRACGLATFTRDLRGGLLSTGATADVVSVVRDYAGQERRPETGWEVRQDVREDYASAADWLDASGAEVISVQHEFGIFGGSEGLHVLDLIERTASPVVTTLHTVLPTPEPPYERALRRVVGASAHVVVMTETARDILAAVYDVPREKVSVVPHGSPDRDPTPAPDLRHRLDLEGRTVFLTFGLLGPSKGIEFALEALPAAVAANPNVLYVILGATHPEIVKREGEVYRESLEDAVRARGLERHVRFVDRYVDNADLWDWLCAADAYVSPYPGLDQICSGTLAYALGAGLPVVSTPYLHAREALADGRGFLVEPGDVQGFGGHLAALAEDAGLRQRMGAKARALGAETTWPKTGAAYRAVFERVIAEHRQASGAAAELLAVHPGGTSAALDYLVRLTDPTGPFQHASHGVPDRAHGYCTDDAGRTLAVALWAAARPGASERERRRCYSVARTCLSFVHHAVTESGTVRNFMDYSRQWLNEDGGEDTAGRALWGLGVAASLAPEAEARGLARSLIGRVETESLSHPRAIAYAALGIDAALDASPGDAVLRGRLSHLARRLVEQFDAESRGDWRWFHSTATYANALLPLALLKAGARLGTSRFTDVGHETLDFVLRHTLRGGMFHAIGNRGWLQRGESAAPYDQQPIEAGYTAHVCAEVWKLTGDARYAAAARAAATWFYGRNVIGQPLFHPETGSSFDGFGPQGVNANQGAESALACVMAHLAAERLPAASPPEASAARGISNRLRAPQA